MKHGLIILGLGITLALLSCNKRCAGERHDYYKSYYVVKGNDSFLMGVNISLTDQVPKWYIDSLDKLSKNGYLLLPFQGPSFIGIPCSDCDKIWSIDPTASCKDCGNCN